MNIMPSSFRKCLGVVFFIKSGIRAVSAAGDRRLSSNCIKKQQQQKILLVNITEKKKQYKVFRYILIQGLNECQRTWSFLLYRGSFTLFFGLHSQAALFCVAAESPHIHPHSSKPSGKESPLPVAELPGFTSIGLIRSMPLHCGQENPKSESAVYFLEPMGEFLWDSDALKLKEMWFPEGKLGGLPKEGWNGSWVDKSTICPFQSPTVDRKRPSNGACGAD